MTTFYKLKDGSLLCATEVIEAGPCKLLKGFVEGVRQPVIRRADECEPLPGAPMPRLHLVESGE